MHDCHYYSDFIFYLRKVEGKHMPRHRNVGSRTREVGTPRGIAQIANALLPLWSAVL